jgi:hypothetical protein
MKAMGSKAMGKTSLRSTYNRLDNGKIEYTLESIILPIESIKHSPLTYF